MNRIDKVKECRVCNDKAHGYHFGVMVCRACAAFFRRTVALNMHYHCRHSNTCAIDKSIRCMCRYCRYSKCLSVGMDPRYGRRNNKNCIANSISPPSIEVISSESSSISPPNMITSTKLDETENNLYFRINRIFDDSINDPRTSSDLTSLEMFRLGLNHIRDRRKVIHKNTFINLKPFYGKDQFLTEMVKNWDLLGNMSNDEVYLHAELLSFIPSFVNLPPDQRWLFFKKFSTIFMTFERTYETYRILGDKCSDLDFVSYNGQPLELFKDMEKESTRLKNYSSHRILRISKATMTFVQKTLNRVMKELKPTEIEFSLLSLHLLWLHPCNEKINDETLRIATMNRRKIFDELHDYYSVSIGMINYASRLGDFMSLLGILEKLLFEKQDLLLISEINSLGKTDSAVLAVSR